MTEGDIIEWDIGNGIAPPPGINGWKFAATWGENYYNNSPDIRFELVDTCPIGGGEEIVRTAVKYPHKARIRMRDGDMATMFDGRCLSMRATVEHADGLVYLYTADYYYSTPRIQHEIL